MKHECLQLFWTVCRSVAAAVVFVILFVAGLFAMLAMVGAVYLSLAPAPR